MNDLHALTTLPAASRDARIIDLCDRAITDLTEARTLDQVREIAGMAEAFAAYTRKMKAALEAQNAVHLVVLLAEAKIGAELKAAQERGEVATQERKASTVPAGNGAPASAAEIGLTRKQTMNAKALAAAGEARIREEVANATAERRRPSRRSILRHIPTLAARPPEYSRFTLWLGNGASVIPDLGDPSALPRAMAEFKMFIPPHELRAVHAFLSVLMETIDAGEA